MIMIVIRGPICAGKSTICSKLRDLIPNTSLVTADRIKRAVDNVEVSAWRDEIAFKTSLYCAGLLVERKRVLIVDIHSNTLEQYSAFKRLAVDSGYQFYSFLLHPPIRVCLERNRAREIPEVAYKISDVEVREYWQGTIAIPDEKIFDTSKVSSEKLCDRIMKYVRS